MTVEAEAATGASVSFTVSAVGRENQTLPVTCSRPGSRFPLGQTTVTCTAQDRPDEIVTKTFRITVVDRTAPRLVVPASVKVRTANKKGAVVKFAVSATDLVDGTLVPTCSPTSSTLFRIGATRVECTATDRGRTSPVPRSPSASSWCGKRGRSGSSHLRPARSSRRLLCWPGDARRRPRTTTSSSSAAVTRS